MIVLEVYEDHVVVAEGNYNSSIHWGRTISASEVNAGDYKMTRYIKTTPAVQAACTETGKTEGICCALCGEVFKEPEEIAALGHQECVIEAEEPGCEHEGRTEGSYCSRCSEVFVQSEVIAAKGHSYDEGRVTKKPSTEEEGSIEYTCRECGSKKTEPVKRLTAQNIKLDTASKTISFKALKKSRKTFSIKASGNQTALQYESKGKRAKKYITVSSSGVVTVNKGFKRGKYEILLTAEETEEYGKSVQIFEIIVK